MSGVWLAALGTAVVHALWQGAVIVAVAEAVLRAAGVSAPRLRYGVAGCALVLLAAAFIATFVAAATGVTAAVGSDSAGVAARLAEPALSLNTLTALGWLWLGTAVLGGVRFAWGIRAVRRLVGSAAPSRDPALRRAMRAARRHVRTGRRTVLLEARRDLDSPVAVGWITPAVVVPAAFAQQLSYDHQVAVLAHELEHVRRGDGRDAALIRALAILVGFHPAAALLVRRIVEAREEACDDAAAAAVGALVYARALERLERIRPRRVRLHFALAASPTCARILRVLRPARSRPRAAIAAGAIGFSALLLLAPASLPRAAAEGSALARRAFPLMTIQANDPAGAFTLALRAGRVVAATVSGATVPRERLVQRGDSIRILDPAGAPQVSVQVTRDGRGISWSARPARSPAP